jgi:formylglycine-generating enzyme required for sulfatase activity
MRVRTKTAISDWLRSNVLGLVAIFIALSGTAYATHPGGQNTIDTKDIINAEVRTEDIRDANVTRHDLGIGSVNSAKVVDNSLTGTDIDEAALDATPLRTRVAQGGCEGNSPADVMVKVGSVCVDKYENSIWDAPTGGNQITGTIPCNANGQDCTNIYARSVAGVEPRAQISWFQAQQALANSGKRLPTNAEWQMAVTGTPDPGTDNGTSDCNVTFQSGEDPVNTGSRSACVSNHGANDMVGNLFEWVADWDEDAAGCENWTTAGFGNDEACMGRAEGDADNHLPGALLRGGSFISGTDAGPFAVSAESQPSDSGSSGFGFRGAR